MKVLVTGASGFLGSWICRVLSQSFAVTALLREESDTYKLEGIDSLTLLRTSEPNWHQTISNANFDVLILNDWWGVGNKHRNDPRQFENITRFEKSLDAAKKIKPKLIIGVGSQAELGPVSGEISEFQPDNPTSSYGEAKVQARKLLFENNLETISRIAWLRVFSTYGPLDEEGWLIPDTIKNLIHDQKMDLTPGDQIWSYLHAYDLAKAVERIIVDQEISGIVNAGNPNTIKIKEVVSEISSILEKRNLLNFGAIPYREDQVMTLIPKCEKLLKSGWQPKVDFHDGLIHLINWFKGNNSYLKFNDGSYLDLNVPKIKL